MGKLEFAIVGMVNSPGIVCAVNRYSVKNGLTSDLFSRLVGATRQYLKFVFIMMYLCFPDYVKASFATDCVTKFCRNQIQGLGKSSVLRCVVCGPACPESGADESEVCLEFHFIVLLAQGTVFRYCCTLKQRALMQCSQSKRTGRT
jgi:hypothetical protein